jgi:hypothetical protein
MDPRQAGRDERAEREDFQCGRALVTVSRWRKAASGKPAGFVARLLAHTRENPTHLIAPLLGLLFLLYFVIILRQFPAI